MFPFIISTTGHEKPLSQLPLAFCHPASLKVRMGMLNAQSMQYSRTLLFFFFSHTCIMCFCKLGFSHVLYSYLLFGVQKTSHRFQLWLFIWLIYLVRVIQHCAFPSFSPWEFQWFAHGTFFLHSCQLLFKKKKKTKKILTFSIFVGRWKIVVQSLI